MRTPQEVLEQLYPKHYQAENSELTFAWAKTAMEEYGKEVWAEACKAQMKEVYAAIGAGQNTNEIAIRHWTKTPGYPKG